MRIQCCFSIDYQQILAKQCLLNMRTVGLAALLLLANLTTHAKTSEDTCEKPMHRLTLLLIAVARRNRKSLPYSSVSPFPQHSLPARSV